MSTERAPSVQEIKTRAAVQTFTEIMQEIIGGPVAYVVVIANGSGSNLISNVDEFGAQKLLDLGQFRLNGSGHKIATDDTPAAKVH